MATTMPSPLPQLIDEHNDSLSSLPPKVSTKIFCNFSSFSDVFALAATCHRLRQVWSTSVIPIYNSVAPQSIAFERDAHRFLIDQIGQKLDSPMTAEAVVQMVRNARIVEKAILQFEQEIVGRVRGKITLKVVLIGAILTFRSPADGASPEDFYGARATKHPPNLTTTERTRFIRTYYSLWGLMKLDPAEWPPRLESLTQQQLYYLLDLAKLTQSIGYEEDIPPPPFPNSPPDSIHAINMGQSDKRIALENTLHERIQHISQRFFQRDAGYPIAYAKGNGFLFFVALWDHWQPYLEDMVSHLSRSTIKLSPEETRRYFWDDNFDKKS